MHPFRAILLLMVLLTLPALGCDDPPLREWRPSDHGQPRRPEAETATAPVASDPHGNHVHGMGGREEGAGDEVSRARAMLRAAQALWRMSCAKCHGARGEGGGPELAAGAVVPDFTDPAFQRSRKDDDLKAIISDGKGTMPGFGKRLNAHALEALVVYIRTLGMARQAAGMPEPEPAGVPSPGAVPAPSPPPEGS